MGAQHPGSNVSSNFLQSSQLNKSQFIKWIYRLFQVLNSDVGALEIIQVLTMKMKLGTERRISILREVR